MVLGLRLGYTASIAKGTLTLPLGTNTYQEREQWGIVDLGDSAEKETKCQSIRTSGNSIPNPALPLV